MITATHEIDLSCACACELGDRGLPLELLPVVYEDARVIAVICKAEADLIAKAAVEHLAREVGITKSVRDFLRTHGRWERKVAGALHQVMMRMKRDVQRRIKMRLSTEPTVVLPIERWWRAASAAVVGTLRRAAIEAGKETLRDYNRRVKPRRARLVKQVGDSSFTWQDDGQVLIDIPPDARAAMNEGITETMGKDYWLKWEDNTRNMAFQTMTAGLDNHLNLLQIADLMDDAWAFDYRRAMLVARTETTSAMNFGHYAVGQELIEDKHSAVNGRQWISIIDKDTRDAHRAANNQKVERTAKGAWEVRQGSTLVGTGPMFIVGGEKARFPGDPNLSAGQRINCRCLEIALLGGKVARPGAVGVLN